MKILETWVGQNYVVSQLDVVVVPLLGLPVLFFDLLGPEEGGVCKFFDVRNVVVLGDVNPKHRTCYEREVTPYDSHPNPRRQCLRFSGRLKSI